MAAGGGPLTGSCTLARSFLWQCTACSLADPTPPATLLLVPQMSREVVGRLMADPAFVQKLVLEQMITVGSTLIYEAKVG